VTASKVRKTDAHLVEVRGKGQVEMVGVRETDDGARLVDAAGGEYRMSEDSAESHVWERVRRG
jgi:hypothetical protein